MSYLTPEEAAQQLKVEVKEIMSLIEEGKLRAISIGTHTRIPEAEMENLLVTSAAGPTPPTSLTKKVLPDLSRLVPTRTGRATFRVLGSIAEGAQIWPGDMRYPIRFPKPFMDSLLAHFGGGEVAVGGSFDGPVASSLGEFIQKGLKTRMNPAVYVAALLIDEGYADASRRGYIRFRSRGNAVQQIKKLTPSQ
jgi:excisionase family DNA binding protein